jgi:hypothetical protein
MADAADADPPEFPTFDPPANAVPTGAPGRIAALENLCATEAEEK